MARKTEIQYVEQFYVFGTEAPKPASAPKAKKPAQPKINLDKFQTIYVDPVAVCGVIAAAVMLCFLVAGAFRLRDTRAEYDRMKEMLSEVKRENAQLDHSYHTGYDLDDIREQAEKQGMIPAEDGNGFTVFFSVPEAPKEKTAWDDFKWFLSWLFSKSEDYVVAEKPADAE